MATKSEIKEWLEACGAKDGQVLAFTMSDGGPWVARAYGMLFLPDGSTPLHLLNETLTGVQGPTFAEWKKQRGRRERIDRIRKVFMEWTNGQHMRVLVAQKILDAIEGEGE